MRLSTFNVLADAYIGYGDYSNVDSRLLVPGARTERIYNQVNSLNVDIIGLQEADVSLVDMFKCNENWQSFWAPKGNNKPDGCLTLVKSALSVDEYESAEYSDKTGFVYQILNLGKVAIINTHLKWAPEEDLHHTGVLQTQELLGLLSNYESAILLADCNGLPGGKVQRMFEQSGFMNLSGENPTAVVDGELVAIDLLAIRGLSGALIQSDFDLRSIPNETCSPDHIPLVAEIDL